MVYRNSAGGGALCVFALTSLCDRFGRRRPSSAGNKGPGMRSRTSVAHRTRGTPALLVAACAPCALAQTISPPLIIDIPPGAGTSLLSMTESHWGETSIAVNPLDTNEIMFSAMLNVIAGNDRQIYTYWFVSLDGASSVAGGGAFFSFGSGACTGFGQTMDPTVTVDPESGYMWAGGLAQLEEDGIALFVSRRAPGSTSITAPHVVVCPGTCFGDKPLLAAGPQPGGEEGDVALYIGWHVDPTSQLCLATTSAGDLILSRAWITPAFTDDVTVLGNSATWQPDSRIYHPTLNPTTNTYHQTSEYYGRAVVPKVLPGGYDGQTPLRGRIVAAIADQREPIWNPGLPAWENNEGAGIRRQRSGVRGQEAGDRV
jgi:hypothetical protein